MKPWIIWHKEDDKWIVRYERSPEHYIELYVYGDLKMTQQEFRSMLAQIVWQRRSLLRDVSGAHRVIR